MNKYIACLKNFSPTKTITCDGYTKDEDGTICFWIIHGEGMKAYRETIFCVARDAWDFIELVNNDNT